MIDTKTYAAAAPSVTSIVFSNPSLNRDETSTVTITFLEAVTNFDNSTVTVDNGSLSTLSSSDGGVTWEATFTPNADVENTTNVLSIADTYTNLEGVNGSTATSSTFAIDSLAPSVSSIVMDNTLINANSTSGVTITFSEAVTDFDNSDVSAQSGTLDTLVSNDGGLTWTAVFTPDSEVQSNTNVITVGSNYTDLSGNFGSEAISDNYSVDTIMPTVVSIVMDNYNLNIGAIANVTITFSEPVRGFDNNDVYAQGGSLDELTTYDGFVTWTAVFTPYEDIQSLTSYIVVMPEYLDFAGNQAISYAMSDLYTVDTSEPFVNSITVSPSDLNIGSNSVVNIVFSEPVTGFDNTDVTVSNGVLDTLVTEDNMTWTATFTPDSGIEVTGNVITVGSDYTDLAGNPGLSGGVSNAYNIDTLPPMVSYVYMNNTELSICETSDVVIRFSEPVVGFDNSDVIASNGTLSSLILVDNGFTWIGHFIPYCDLEMTDNFIMVGTDYTDLAGNYPEEVAYSDFYNIDTVGPTVSYIDMDNTNLTAGDTAIVTIAFSEPVMNFDNSNVIAQNGVLSPLATDDNIHWTGLFVPNYEVNNSENLIIVGPYYTDLAGNSGFPAISDNFTINTDLCAESAIIFIGSITYNFSSQTVSSFTDSGTEQISSFSVFEHENLEVSTNSPASFSDMMPMMQTSGFDLIV